MKAGGKHLRYNNRTRCGKHAPVWRSLTLALVLKAGAQPWAKPPVQLVPDQPAGGEVTVICFAVKDRVPDPKDPVEAEKSGMPCIIVSAVGESPRATPSTSTPLKPNGLSDTSVPDFRTPPSENWTYYIFRLINNTKPSHFDGLFSNCNFAFDNSSNYNIQKAKKCKTKSIWRVIFKLYFYLKNSSNCKVQLQERTITWRWQIQWCWLRSFTPWVSSVNWSRVRIKLFTILVIQNVLNKNDFSLMPKTCFWDTYLPVFLWNGSAWCLFVGLPCRRQSLTFKILCTSKRIFKFVVLFNFSAFVLNC